MDDDALDESLDAMRRDGIAQPALDAFAHNYRALAGGATGMIAEADIEPYDPPALGDEHVSEDERAAGLATTAVIKLNGGLGTSMGLDRAKSLLQARDDLTFLDVIARQVLALRRTFGARLPITFLHSFRTSADSLQALAAYPDLITPGVTLEVRQNRIPKLRAGDLRPVRWPADPSLEWCPPGHGDLYPVLQATGLIDTLLAEGFTQAFVSNSDNLGALPDPGVAGWFASSGAPFAIEAVRRTPSDRKGGHFARRRRDGRIVLRESAQTRPEDREALADLTRHRFTSTNNLWFDLAAMRSMLATRNGVLDLPLIKNVKTVDPADAHSPQVVQLETAMGAAIELFDGALAVEVERDRFIPVKTTNDLLVLRSDCYRLDDEYRLEQASPSLPFVDLDATYTTIEPFEHRFARGVPSLIGADALVVHGDWAFGADVRVVGTVELGPEGGVVVDGTVLGGPG
ncbi:MAG: UTP--glucose-1-phosphate uridylyltransferase [Ilumatobacteraceae bacterium]